ncbi:MAG: VacB/RNase II family 3'-5' exoribonuclease, partial [Myxococcales bacterium]|nr:VacB/RNase II family 3'-5' exoribonuclease [Myxococcales bacterium]
FAGEVVEVLGRPGEPEPDFRAVVWHRRLPVEFPDDVAREVEAIVAPEPGEAPADGSGVPWEDLRELPFVTIDPVTARDHDDAVWVEAGPSGGYRLWVAIADVAGFVPRGSALDREALRRGNSVYFPDRAIPMLPDRLSGDLCSLRAGVDRPALIAQLEIGADGAVRSKRFRRAWIRSRAGLHYGQAAAAMAGDAAALPDPDLLEPLQRLAACARALETRRMAAGAVDLDLPSPEISLDPDGMPVDIQEAARTQAHRAIEEAMLAANRAVAEHLLAADVPAVYRVHEPPPAEDANDLRRVLASFGLVDGRGRGPLSSGEVAEAIRRAEGRPEERLVNLTTLRSMQQARYETENRGHFALAFEAYLHFTSPIRRYADLAVHRALLASLAGGEAVQRARGGRERLASVAVRVSYRERVAMRAERDMLDLKKCAFMARHLGESFPGTVTSVARQGLYVTLDPFFVEGLVHVSSLTEWVEFDEAGHALVARGSGRRFGMGDRYRVLVEQVDPVNGWINFSIEETLEGDAGDSPDGPPASA